MPSSTQVNLISFKLDISLADQLNNYLNYLLSSGGVLQSTEALSLINTIPQVGISDTMNILKKLSGVISEPISFSSNNFEGGLYPIKNTTVEVSSTSYNINIPVIPNLPPNSAVVAISWSNTTSFSNETTLSNIISVSVSNKGVDQSVSNLTSPIVLTWNMSNIINPPNMTLKCSYWNYTSLSWKSDGCNITIISNMLICECTHMTDFVVKFERIIEMNKNLFENAGNVYSLEGLEKYKNYYIFYGCYFFIMVVITYGLHKLDIKNSEQYYKSLIHNFDIIKFKKEIPNFYIDKCYLNKDNDLWDYDEYHEYQLKKYKIINELKKSFNENLYLNDIITILVDEELDKHHNNLIEITTETDTEKSKLNKSIYNNIYTIINLWWKRLLYHHNYLSIFFKYDPQSPRIFRIFFIFIIISHTLFMTALLYGYSHDMSGQLDKSSIIESVVLSVITSLINVPFINFITKVIGTVGKEEFKWRYPFIYRELHKMIIFEEVYYQSKNKNNNTSIEINNKEDNFITSFIIEYLCKNCYKNKNKMKDLSKDELFEYRINNEIVKISNIPLDTKWWYSFNIPFHTLYSLSSFIGFLLYLIWTINYLLLFSSSTQSNVEIQILQSFGISQILSIILITPITLLFTLLFTWGYHKYIKKTSFASNILPLYYHSDPFVNNKSIGLTVRLSKSLFLQSIASSSIHQPSDERIIAPIKGLVASLLNDKSTNNVNKEYYEKVIKYHKHINSLNK